MKTEADNTIVFIDHHENPMDDIAWSHLGEMGFHRRLVCPFRGEALDMDPAGLAGVVVYGGSQNVGEQEQNPFLGDETEWLKRCLEVRTPILGICLGGQLLAHALGAEVGPRQPRQCEFGYYEVTPTDAGKQFMPQPMTVTQAHFEEFQIPQHAVRLVTGDTFPNQAFLYDDFALGLQFHPEVTPQIFRRWQQAIWAMYGARGAQTRDQQDSLMAIHSPQQERWFRETLATLFTNTAAGAGAGKNKPNQSGNVRCDPVNSAGSA